MSIPSLWLRRSMARRGLLSATAATALVVTFLVVVIAGLAVQSERPAIRQTIAAGPIQTVGVSAETDLSTDPSAQNAAVAAKIAVLFPGIRMRVERSVSTGPLRMRAADASRAGVSSVVVMSDDSTIRQAIRVTSGSWPGTRAGSRYPVAVQARAAKALGLHVGDRFDIPSSSGALPLTVVATWLPASAAADVWFGDQRVSTGRAGDAVGPMIVGPAALAKIDATRSVRWVIAPDADTLTPGDLGSLVSGFTRLHARFSASDTISSTVVTVTGDGRTTAAGMQQSIAALGAVLSLPIALLAVGAVLALVLLARLLVDTREVETELLRARGATAATIVRAAAAEAAAIAIIAAAVGGAGATGVILLASSASPSPITVIGPAAVMVICVVIVHAAVTAGAVRGALGVARDSSRTRSVASLGLSILVVLAAAFALWRFLQYGATGGAIDVSGVAAPALVLLATVLLGLVAFGPVARFFESAGSRSAGVGVALPARQVGRGLTFFVAPVALIILSIGGTVLGSGYIGTWSGYSSTAARVVNAGDIRVDTGTASPVRGVGDSIGAAAYRSVQGVTAAAPALRLSGTIGQGAVPVIAAPADRLADIFGGDGAAIGEDGILDRIGTRADDALEGVALPRGATEIALGVRAETSGEGGASGAGSRAVTAQFTVWVADQAGEIAPVTPAAVPVAAHSGGPASAVSTASVRLPAGPRPLRIVAVDTAISGADAATALDVGLERVTATVGGTRTSISVADQTGWKPASAVFAEVPGLRADADGIGFRLPLVVASADGGGGGTPTAVRLMPGKPVRPAVAITTALAASAGLAVGDGITIDGGWWTVDATVADVVPVVPGVKTPEAAMFDLPALQDSLLRAVASPPATNEAWLATTDVDRSIGAVRRIAGPDAAVTVAGTAFVDRFFAAARLGLWLGCFGCIALAVIALAATTAALSRRRRAEVSVFRALGFSARQQRGARRAELWVVVGVAALIGLAAGILVTALVAAPLARLSVVTAPSALPVAVGADPIALIVGLGTLAVAVAAVVLAYGASIVRQAADSEYREETR